jgi:hypothetical protein
VNIRVLSSVRRRGFSPSGVELAPTVEMLMGCCDMSARPQAYAREGLHGHGGGTYCEAIALRSDES